MSLRRPAFLDDYEGEWVAVADNTVVAHSPHSTDLVPMVRNLPAAVRDRAVVEFVCPPTDYWLVP